MATPIAPVVAASPPVRPEPVDRRPPTTAEIVARCEPSVALIRGKSGSGTGFLIRPGLLVTNAHVLDGEIVQDLEILFPSAPEGEKGPLSADLVYEDSVRDLAVLSVETRLAPLALADAHAFRKGDDVLTIGNPGAVGETVLENAVSRGVLSTQTEIDGRAFHQLGMSVNPGNSGGPVLDPDGRVIGVVTLRLENAEALAFCVPLDDLRAAVEAAESRTRDLAGGKRSVSSIPELAYRWEPGATLVYAVKLRLDLGRQAQTMEGTSIYKVQSAGDESITLKHRGWLSTRVHPKNDTASPGPGPANPVEGTVEIDPRGYVLKSEGSTPVSMLGDLSMLMLEPLPERPKASWEVAQTVALEHTQVREAPAGGLPIALPGFHYDRGWPGSRLAGMSPFPPRFGRYPGAIPGFGRERPAPPQRSVEVTTWPAQEQASYVIEPQDDEGFYPIKKTYQLRTQDATDDGEPRLHMTGNGTLTFDAQRGRLVGVTYSGRMVYSTESVTVRVPLTLTCRLLEGAERDRAVVVPTLHPTPNRPLDAKGIGQALADLASGDDGRAISAARTLGDAAPVASRREDVAAALLKCLDRPSHVVRSLTVRALGVWGDESTRLPLIERLNASNYGVQAELLEALARLGPDTRSAAAMVSQLPRDPHHAGNALRAMGPVAEELLMTLVESSTPGNQAARVEAARVLATVGTTRSLDRLRVIASRRESGRLARMAAETLRQIEVRHPGAEAIDGFLNELAAADLRRRQVAVEALAKVAPTDALRDRVTRAFAANLEEPDDHMAVWSVRGLAAWGGPDARDAVARAVADLRFRHWREALNTLPKLGPGPESINAVMTRLKDDPYLVVRTLAVIGSPAEPALLSLLNHQDAGVCREACRALGSVGTAECLERLEALAKDADDVFLKGEAASALKALTEHPEAGSELNFLLASLRSGDRQREDEALRRLADLEPDDARRAEVLRALDKFLIDDVFRMEHVARAAARWADDPTREKLLRLMTDGRFRTWVQIARALAANDPDEATLRAIAARFKDDRHHVANALKTLGPRAEGPLLGLVEDASQSFEVRADALHVLAEIGTSKSVDPLRAMAASADDESIASAAEDAIRAIERMW